MLSLVTGFCEIIINFGSIKNWQFIDNCASLDVKGLIVQWVAGKTHACLMQNFSTNGN
jgi:hypothetical protein